MAFFFSFFLNIMQTNSVVVRKVFLLRRLTNNLGLSWVRWIERWSSFSVCHNSYDNILFGWLDCSVEINYGQLSQPNLAYHITLYMVWNSAISMQVYFKLTEFNIIIETQVSFNTILRQICFVCHSTLFC